MSEDKQLDPRIIQRAKILSESNSFIYIVKCHEFYKIGIASHIDNRLNSLQCGNPYQLEIVYAVRCPEAKVAEQTLHICFEDKRVRGEWFLLNDNDIIDIKKTIDELINKYGRIYKNKRQQATKG